MNNATNNVRDNTKKIDIYTAHKNIKRYYEVKRTILEQYKTAVKILNTLFDFAPEESHLKDGIGKCKISKTNSEAGIKGPAESIILQKRDEELKKALSKHQHLMGLNDACPFHKFGEGCILGHLKSPLCTAHYEEGKISEIYNAKYVRRILETILEGNYSIEEEDYKPEENWKLVEEIKNYSRNLVQQVQNRK